MADFAARMEGELAIDDDYMEANFANPDAVIDVVKRTPIAAFLPASQTVPLQGANHSFMTRGVSVDYARDTSGSIDTDATHGTLNRCLHNEQAGQNVLRRYQCAITHQHGIRFIYPYLSTARGISLYD